jgi:hypothetical protein
MATSNQNSHQRKPGTLLLMLMTPNCPQTVRVCIKIGYTSQVSPSAVWPTPERRQNGESIGIGRVALFP